MFIIIIEEIFITYLTKHPLR